MKDPRLEDMMKSEAMPFDGKRMVYGGFSVAVNLAGHPARYTVSRFLASLS